MIVTRFSTGIESTLDAQPAAEVHFSAADAGDAERAGNSASGQREAAAGRHERGGQQRQEKVPATGAAGATAETTGDCYPKGLVDF